MNIVVCVKQTLNKYLDKENVMSDYDRNALDVGVKLKEKIGGKLIVLSMGPKKNEEILELSLLMGADEAVLLSDKALSGSDTFATSYALSKAIENIGNVGIVICGKKSLDGDTSQVGPQIASNLSYTLISYVTEVMEINEKITVKANNGTGYDIIKSDIPCVICIEKDTDNAPITDLRNFNKFKEKEIKTLSIDSIGISADKVGNAGSKTKVVNIYEPENISNCQFIDQDNDDENAKRLIDELNIDILINCQKGVS